MVSLGIEQLTNSPLLFSEFGLLPSMTASFNLKGGAVSLVGCVVNQCFTMRESFSKDSRSPKCSPPYRRLTGLSPLCMFLLLCPSLW